MGQRNATRDRHTHFPQSAPVGAHRWEAVMADTTSLQLDAQQYRLRAVAERRAGNDLEAQAWDAEADALEQRIILLAQT